MKVVIDFANADANGIDFYCAVNLMPFCLLLLHCFNCCLVYSSYALSFFVFFSFSPSVNWLETLSVCKKNCLRTTVVATVTVAVAVVVVVIVNYLMIHQHQWILVCCCSCCCCYFSNWFTFVVTCHATRMLCPVQSSSSWANAHHCSLSPFCCACTFSSAGHRLFACSTWCSLWFWCVCVHLHSSQLLPYFVSSCAHHHLSYWPTAAAAVAAAVR